MKTQNTGENHKLLKCFAISDTHQYSDILQKVSATESGDVFVHAGDFTDYCQDKYIDEFVHFMRKINFKYKIVISGNHEIVLDDCMSERRRKAYLAKYPCKYSKKQILDKLKSAGCIYLQHQHVDIQGVRFFGSPYTPYFVGNAFQYDLKYDEEIWSSIPEKVDVLITHGPPYKILDKNIKNVHAGSVAMEKYSKLRRPKYHVFGHIHESQGQVQQNGTLYANIAMRGLRFTVSQNE